MNETELRVCIVLYKNGYTLLLYSGQILPLWTRLTSKAPALQVGCQEREKNSTIIFRAVVRLDQGAGGLISGFTLSTREKGRFRGERFETAAFTSSNLLT